MAVVVGVAEVVEVADTVVVTLGLVRVALLVGEMERVAVLVAVPVLVWEEVGDLLLVGELEGDMLRELVVEEVEVVEREAEMEGEVDTEGVADREAREGVEPMEAEVEEVEEREGEVDTLAVVVAERVRVRVLRLLMDWVPRGEAVEVAVADWVLVLGLGEEEGVEEKEGVGVVWEEGEPP